MFTLPMCLLTAIRACGLEAHFYFYAQELRLLGVSNSIKRLFGGILLELMRSYDGGGL